MFKQLRDKKTKKMIWIILAVLVLPGFLLWGSGSVMRSRQTTAYAGRIFGRKVSFLEYRDALDAVKNQAIMQYGENFSEAEKNLNLESEAWRRLLLLYEAKKRKIRLSDAEVIEQIRRYPFFQRKDKFDESIYNQLLQYVFRTQPRAFEEQVRENMAIAKLYEQVTQAVTITEDETRIAFRKNNEKISLFFIVSNYADFTKEVNPTDAEVEEYFAQNSMQFKQPLSFNLEYIAVPTEGKDEAGVQTLLKGIAKRLNKNTDLARIAGELNTTAKETGLFGQTEPIPGIGWSPEITGFIFKAKAKEFLPLIYLDKKYYIMRLKEKRDPYIPGLDEIRAKVREALVKERAQAIARQKIDGALSKLRDVYAANPRQVDFEKTAASFGLRSGSTDLFTFGTYVEGIGSSDALWVYAQAQEEGQISEVITLPSGFYIIRLKSRMPFDEKRFSEEKTRLAEEALLQKKTEHFTKFLTELQQKARLY